MTTTTAETTETVRPLPTLCPECGASFPTLIDSLSRPENDEDYSTAMTIVRNCKSCRQYITAFACGEKKLKELLARKGESDIRRRVEVCANS